MIFIDKHASNIELAKVIHVKNVVCRIRRKVTGKKCLDKSCKICKSKSTIISGIPFKLFVLLNDEDLLRIIIDCDPEEHLELCEGIWKELVNNFSWDEYNLFLKAKSVKPIKRTFNDHVAVKKFSEYYTIFEKIFDYDTWFQNSDNKMRYDAYSLAFNLNRNTCTYCNRIYTNTMKSIKGKKVMRPTFDHWYSKSKFPMLALTFYNLIPSCSICNSSIKGDIEFTTNTHLHPYIDLDKLNEFFYSYNFSRSTQKFDIKIKSDANSPRIFNTYNDLKLKDIYNAHHAELADMIKIKEAYSEKYIENMLKAYPKAKLSYSEAFRLAFGTELNNEEFYKLPLSKFKRDILKELKFLDFFNL